MTTGHDDAPENRPVARRTTAERGIEEPSSSSGLEDNGGSPPPARPAKTSDLENAAATARNKKFRRSKSREGGGGSGIEESSDEEDDPPLPADPVSSDAAADGLGLGFTKGGKAGGALTGKLGTEDMEVVLPAVATDEEGEGSGEEKKGNFNSKDDDDSPDSDGGGGGFFCCCRKRKKPRQRVDTVINTMFELPSEKEKRIASDGDGSDGGGAAVGDAEGYLDIGKLQAGDAAATDPAATNPRLDGRKGSDGGGGGGGDVHEGEEVDDATYGDDSTYGAVIDTEEGTNAEASRAKNTARAGALLSGALEEQPPEEHDLVYAIPVEETNEIGSPPPPPSSSPSSPPPPPNAVDGGEVGEGEDQVLPAVPRRSSLSAGAQKKRTSVYGGFGDDFTASGVADSRAETHGVPAEDTTSSSAYQLNPGKRPAPLQMSNENEGMPTSYSGTSYREDEEPLADAEDYQTPSEILGLTLPSPKPTDSAIAEDSGGGSGGGDGDDDDGLYAALEHTAYSATAESHAAAPPPSGFKKKAESYRGFARAPTLKLQGSGGGGGVNEAAESNVDETTLKGANGDPQDAESPKTCDRYKLDFHRRGICKTCNLSREDCNKIRPASMLPPGPGSKPKSRSIAPPTTVTAAPSASTNDADIYGPEPTNTVSDSGVGAAGAIGNDDDAPPPLPGKKTPSTGKGFSQWKPGKKIASLATAPAAREESDDMYCDADAGPVQAQSSEGLYEAVEATSYTRSGITSYSGDAYQDDANNNDSDDIYEDMSRGVSEAADAPPPVPNRSPYKEMVPDPDAVASALKSAVATKAEPAPGTEMYEMPTGDESVDVGDDLYEVVDETLKKESATAAVEEASEPAIPKRRQNSIPKRNSVRNKERWKVDDRCVAVYAGDGLCYEGTIARVLVTECHVIFDGYDEHEVCPLEDIYLMAEFEASRKVQVGDAAEATENAEDLVC